MPMKKREGILSYLHFCLQKYTILKNCFANPVIYVYISLFLAIFKFIKSKVTKKTDLEGNFKSEGLLSNSYIEIH